MNLRFLRSALLAAAALTESCSAAKPPTDDAVATMLHEHATGYLEIVKLLQTESRVREIASWGIRVEDSPLASVPPNAEMTLARFQEYRALLAEVHGQGASRSAGAQPEVCILVWAAGWNADTKHVNICWLAHAPDAGRLAHSPTSLQRQVNYSPIEDNWYVQRDW